MVTAPLWLWFSLANPLLAVDGNSTCPTPREVADRVAALLPVEHAAVERDVVQVDNQGSAVRVQLRRPDGRIVGERTLQKRFGCADLAAAAAIVVAAWESDVHPEFLRSLAAPPRPPAVEPVTVVAPPTAMPPAASSSLGAAFDIGIALTGAVAPDQGGAGPALGGLLVASWTPAARGFGARLGAQASSERQMRLPSGDVRWRRAALSGGVQYRIALQAGRWLLDLHADALVARVSVHGVGFAISNLSDTGVDPGVGAGVRLLWHAGIVAPWLELAGGGWLRRQVVVEDPTRASRALPRLEANMAIGVSYCACP
jgi:hypothetical protein